MIVEAYFSPVRKHIIKREWGGKRYVYLIYADDSARDNKWQVISALIMRDSDFEQVEWGLNITTLFYAPENIRDDFEFHSSDLWNRRGVFSALNEENVNTLFGNCASIIAHLGLSIVYGAVDVGKLKSGLGLYSSASPIDIAFRICVSKIEKWFAANAPKELGLLVCDDTQNKSHKNAIQNAFRMLRPKGQPLADEFRGSLAHLHDDLYFGDSKYSVGIQLSDICSFLIMHHLDGQDQSKRFYEMLSPHIADFGIEPV
jgi:hypothetical protein